MAFLVEGCGGVLGGENIHIKGQYGEKKLRDTISSRLPPFSTGLILLHRRTVKLLTIFIDQSIAHLGKMRDK